MTRTITLQLPDALYQSAQKIAVVTKRPVDEIIRESLANTLPPIDDIPADEVESVISLSNLSDAQLWDVANQTLSVSDQDEMTALLDGQNQASLSEGETGRLQTLMDEYGRLMVRKSHAWLLLARRGYSVPTQNA